MDVELIITFCFSLLRLATPTVYAALAASVCYKASVDNMAIESMMLWAALAGVIVSGASKSAVVGFGAAILAGILVGLIISYASFTGKADLYLTNIAMNLAAAGGTVFVLFLASGDKSNSAGSIQSMVLPVVNLPFIKDIPVLGRIVSGHNILTYGAFAAAFLVNFFIYKTRLGLRLRSVGENPQAAESVGISATKIRYIAFMISGALAGVGGAYMSMGYMSAFVRNMVAGRGFIGLSASNMVAGSPLGVLVSSFIFGSADVFANILQMTSAPADLVLMLPYAITILGLVVISIVRRRREKKIQKAAIR